MPKLINLPTFTDDRGSLTVIEKSLPFDIKRIYFIYNSKGHKRGFHKHKKTRQALVSLSGRCTICIEVENKIKKFNLDSPNNCLILEPEDFHWMENFEEKTVLLVVASEFYDKNDYINNGLQ